jgi:anthranilate/para-aminobenzoate synthase component I
LQSVFDIAGDLDTPVSAFMKLAAFKPRFLLESVEGGERLARYSFVGFGDAFEVRLDAAGLSRRIPAAGPARRRQAAGGAARAPGPSRSRTFPACRSPACRKMPRTTSCYFGRPPQRARPSRSGDALRRAALGAGV